METHTSGRKSWFNQCRTLVESRGDRFCRVREAYVNNVNVYKNKHGVEYLSPQKVAEIKKEIRKEFRQERIRAIWLAVIAFLIAACVVVFVFIIVKKLFLIPMPS